MLKWKPHPLLSPPTEAEVAAMEPKQLQELWQTYHDAIANAERDPYRYGFKLPHWTEAENVLEERNEILVSGGNRCLAGEQTVYDPAKRKRLRVDEITEAFNVLAYDEATQRFVVASAGKPFQKPVQPLYRVELANGQTLSCSAEHRVLTPFGWKAVGELAVGMSICGTPNMLSEERLHASLPSLLASISDTGREGSRAGGQRLSGKALGSQSGCQFYRCSCDEQLHLDSDGVRETSPSQDDALGCISLCDSICRSPQDAGFRLPFDILDDPEPKCECSRCGQRFDRLSTLDAPRLLGGRFFDSVSRAFCKLFQLACSLFGGQPSAPSGLQFFAGSNLQQSSREFVQPGNQCFSSCGENSSTPVKITSFYYLREGIVWDFEVPGYHNYVAGGVISHNSSKTSWAAHAVVRAAVENPGAVIMCFAQNAEVSIRQQQSAIYDALPEELRRKTLGAEENVSYTRKNGFSKGSLILPGSLSHIIFKTYAQFSNKPDILEGAELGSYEAQWINIGAWCDEYLIGPELLATLRFRLATRNSKMIVTFTPVDGYTETVRDYLEGAKTIKSRPAELLNNRPVPFVQHSKNRDAGIIYFHSQDNPFGGYDRIAKDLRGRPEHEILVRAYGVPVKSASSRFPLFDRGVNVIAHDKIPRENVTRYMILDPAGRKNWFMCWVTVDATDTYYVEREWPDINVGEWAEWKGGKWIGGQGAKGLGFGIKDYVDLILREEDGAQIFERLIDPRLGAAKYQAQDGASSIIEDLADAGLIFLPAPGLDIEDGIQALQTKMAYNIGKPIDALNRPHFYVSDRCQNIIHALQEYTGDGGSDEAWKDPIDTLRYCAIAGCAFIDPAKMKSSKPKGGY